MARSYTHAGGAANELGSLHRAGVAAYLAVHGLAGSPLFGRAGMVPTELSLETRDAVDDLVVLFENGRRWFVQAKRSVDRRAIESTLQQWSSQSFADDDELVLAAREIRGWIKSAAGALDRRREALGAVLSDTQAEGLRRLRVGLDQRSPVDSARRLGAARVLGWACEQPGDAQADNAIARLEGVVVAPEHGAAAFAALRDAFQVAASARQSTGPAQWMKAISDAAIPVLLSVESPGSRAALRSAAVARYRSEWASRRGLLELDAFSPHAPTIQVPGILDGMEVRPDDRTASTSRLDAVVRRNRRFAIVGLPGMGKSEAVRQLAAWLADDPEAPLPIVLRLADLARSVLRIDKVDAASLAEVAAEGRPDRDSLTAGFVEAMAGGHCILLLDGLDEALRVDARVAKRLREFLDGCHPDLGAIVTTRPSSAAALRHLRLPCVDIEPMRGRSAQDALLRAMSLAEPEESREQWLRQGLKVLQVHEEGNRELWQVPMLATLTTLRIAAGDTRGSTVRLFQRVINDSVENWQRRLQAGSLEVPVARFHPTMLGTGFAAIGRLLNTNLDVFVGDAEEAVRGALADWGLPSPEAKLAAAYVVRFWDQIVGVFVSDVRGRMQARSRQFSELGDALSGISNEETRQEWLQEALSDENRRNAMAFAVGADVQSARWLLNEARFAGDRFLRSRAMTWVSELSDEWDLVAPEDQDLLCSAYVEAVQDGLEIARSDANDGSVVATLGGLRSLRRATPGGGWWFAVCMVFAPLQPRHDISVAAAIERAAFEEGLRTLLAAMSILARAQRDGRALNPDEVGAVEKAIRLPVLGPTEPAVRTDRFGVIHIGGDPPSLPAGMGRLALMAAPEAARMGPDIIDHFRHIARGSSVDEAVAIDAALKRTGLSVFDLSGLETVMDGFTTDLATTLDPIWLFDELANLTSSGDVPGNGNDRWRLDALHRLSTAIGIEHASIPEHRNARFIQSHLLSRMIQGVIESHGLDRRELALQARKVAAWPKQLRVWSDLHAVDLSPVGPAGEILDPQVRRGLIEVVAAAPRWMSRAALILLDTVGGDDELAYCRSLSGVGWQNQVHLAWLRAAGAADRYDEITLMKSGPGGLRAGAAMCVAEDDSQGGCALREAFLADPDATVRAQVGASLVEAEAAEYWTCRFCGEENQIGVYICGACRLSSSNSVPVHRQLRENDG